MEVNDLQSILGVVMPIVYIIVGIALVWFLVELVATIRKARKTVTEVNEKLQPTLSNVNRLTAELEPTVQNLHDISDQIKPTVSKVDPLVDRVSLTVDAANLEIMRVDQILEDVTQITGSVSKTVGTVDSVTSAPLELVNTVTDKVRNRLRPRYASNESVQLGSAAQEAKQESNPVRDFVDAASDVASSTVSDMKSRASSRKAARAEKAQASAARESSLNKTAERLVDAVTATTDEDTPAADVSTSSATPSVDSNLQERIQSATAKLTQDAAPVSSYENAGSASLSSYGKHAAVATGAAMGAAAYVTAEDNLGTSVAQDTYSEAATQPASADITAPIYLPKEEASADAGSVEEQPAEQPAAESFAYSFNNSGTDAAFQSEQMYNQEVTYEAQEAGQDYWNTPAEATAASQSYFASTDNWASHDYAAGTSYDIPNDVEAVVEEVADEPAPTIVADNAQAVIAAATAALDSHKQAAFDILYGSDSAATVDKAAAVDEVAPVEADELADATADAFAYSQDEAAQNEAFHSMYFVNDQTDAGMAATEDPYTAAQPAGQIDAHEALLRAINAARQNASQNPGDSAE